MQSGKRVRRRKRNRSEKKLIIIMTAVILTTFILCIRELKAELAEMRTMLKRIEVLQYGKKETAAEVTETEETDYAERVGMAYVEKPVKRTEEETLLKLEELGQSDPLIGEISKNNSLYPMSMLMALANNPEMADYVAGYVRGDQTAISGLTGRERTQNFPLLLQWDPRWGYQPYGDSYIGVAGCGPTCLSMVMYYLTGDEMMTPDRIAAYAMENGYYVRGTGTAWALIDGFPVLYGIEVTETKIAERSLKDALDKGKVLICAMGEGDFTVAGHFVVIYGYNDSGFLINDPNCVARSRKAWAFEEIKGQIKSIWAYGKIWQD